MEESTKAELMEYKATIIENLDTEFERIKKLKVQVKEMGDELDRLISAKKIKKRSLRRINSELMRRNNG